MKLSVLMRRGSTVVLWGSVFAIGLLALILYIFGIPSFARAAMELVPQYPLLHTLTWIGLYLTAIPFYFALSQLLLLLCYIDQNKAFSLASVLALRRIQGCALAVSVFLAAGFMPIIYFAADADDAPGLVLFGLAFTFAPVAIATFLAVLKRLLKQAIDIKTENDLIV